MAQRVHVRRSREAAHLDTLQDLCPYRSRYQAVAIIVAGKHFTFLLLVV